MAATIGLKGGSGTTASIQINGSDRLTIDTAGNITASGSLVSTTAIGVASGGTGLSSAGTVGNSLFSDGSGWTSRAPLVSGTAVTATGTAVDFTGIPAWAKRITVMFNGVSTNGTSLYKIQIGSGSFITSGYVSSAGYSTTAVSETTGFLALAANASSTNLHYGVVSITNLSGFTYIESGNVCENAARVSSTAGGITLGGVLDRVRITTVNGTDTFDAGTINIMYE